MGFDPISLGLMAAGTILGGIQGSKQLSAQKAAQRANEQAAQKAASDAEQATNKANAKKPNIAALMAANLGAAGAGVGGTTLTGPMGAGVDASALGKNTLLGQ